MNLLCTYAGTKTGRIIVQLKGLQSNSNALQKGSEILISFADAELLLKQLAGRQMKAPLTYRPAIR